MKIPTFVPEMKLIYDNIAKINTLCKKHKVKNLFVFGSVLTPRFNDQSDVDLLVDFADVPLEDYADNYFDLKFQLADIFGREVDLVENKTISNPYFRSSVDATKQLIYG